MKIKYIRIENFGMVRFLEIFFQTTISILQGPYEEEMFYVLNFFLWNESVLETLPLPYSDEKTRLTAIAEVEEQRIVLKAMRVDQEMILLAHPDMDPYLDAIRHCPEEDDVGVYWHGKKDVHTRLQKYLDPETTEQKENLFLFTKGYSGTSSFRMCINRYIQGFIPHRLHKGKPYMLSLQKNGVFVVTGEDGSAVFLSETEKQLFRYFCFLHTADFWGQLEKLRNMHHAKKALLIKDFSEFIDEAVDIGDLIEEAQKLDRQIILLQGKRWETKSNAGLDV